MFKYTTNLYRKFSTGRHSKNYIGYNIIYACWLAGLALLAGLGTLPVRLGIDLDLEMPLVSREGWAGHLGTLY